MTQITTGGRKFSSSLFKGKDAPYSLDKFKDVFLESRDSSGYICAQEMLHLVPRKDRWIEWKRLFIGNAELHRHYEAW